MRGGKIPAKAMTKFNVRYCIMLFCGWLPPVIGNILAAICTKGVVALVNMAGPEEMDAVALGKV